MTTRKEIFKSASAKLQQDFNELVVVPHSGEKGGEAERLVRSFLSDRLPQRFGVDAGFIIDGNDNVSPQTDIIIYDALNCPVYRMSESASIFPADFVAATIEVKSRLDKSALLDASEKIGKIKSLVKNRGPEGPFHAQTFCAVFGFSSPIRPETLLGHYCANVAEIGLGAHADYVAILDSSSILLVSHHPAALGWTPVVAFEGMGGAAGEGAHFGAGLIRSGAETLDAFFRFLVANLVTFREHSDFNWRSALSSDEMEVQYLTSHTNEEDPKKRNAALSRYRAKARAMMAATPIRGTDVIELGPSSDSDGPAAED